MGGLREKRFGGSRRGVVMKKKGKQKSTAAIGGSFTPGIKRRATTIC